MPALRDVHSEDEIWALTALVRQFLTMTPEQYRAMRERAEQPPPDNVRSQQRAAPQAESQLHKH